MKRSLVFATCAAFVLMLGGCTGALWPSAKPTVPQKPSASQTSTLGGGETKGLGPQGQMIPLPTVAPQATPVPAPQGKIVAAILLPLSGKNAALGQSMLDAAQQAVFDASESSFELQPKDTAAEGGADAAARDAVREGARVIIGPLFAADVPAVKAVAQANNLTVLTLSTDTSVADRGVYVMGLAPEVQVDRIVAYAISMGDRNFAALVPATPYGKLVADVFRRAISKRGANIVDIEMVDPALSNLAEKIRTLSYQRDNIDALFLPESEGNLKTIADQLEASGFSSKRMHVLGTGLWDAPGVGALSPLLVGGWYASPDSALRRNFISAYTSAYGYEPPRLATLAYDTTALAASLAKQGGRYDEPVLTNPNGFSGLDGIFRLKPSGTVERGMAVNQITADGSYVIDPAPNSFVAAKR